MGRSDDSISRRKNKRSLRKSEEKKSSSSKVSSRVAAIIAAKKRRISGKRSMCQGMCFSLPTPEDPFNDRQGKTEATKKRKRDSKANKKLMEKKSPRLKKESLENNDAHEDKLLELENVENGKSELISSISSIGAEIATNLGTPTCQIFKSDGSIDYWKELGPEKNIEPLSKYLTTCLNLIQNALHNGGALSSEGDKTLFDNAWGLEFWNCYCTGKDVLETNGADSTVEQIAWIASIAADTISMKEEEGTSFTSPILLYLVPSQEKASKVRGVCKALKVLGIHTVGLHSGATIAHQISGLMSCEPNFLVSTPERLLELLSIKAVDISGVSLLVIDGLEAPFRGTYFDAVKSIRKFISGNLRTVVFSDCMNNSSIPAMRKLSQMKRSYVPRKSVKKTKK